MAILISMGIFFLPIIPQLIYWKVYGGSWFFWSYGEEGFFLSNPRIIDFLFSYRKGWFVYTPLMLLLIPGVILLFKRGKEFRVIIPLLLFITVYLFSSWWCWWFSGGFGARALIQYYVFFSIPIAFFVQWVLKKSKPLKIVSMGILSVGIFINIAFTYKFNHFHIHWDGMTKEAWKFTLTKVKFEEEDHAAFKELIDSPNYEKAKLGLPE